MLIRIGFSRATLCRRDERYMPCTTTIYRGAGMAQGKRAGWRATGLLFAMLPAGLVNVGARERTGAQRSASEKCFQAGEPQRLRRAINLRQTSTNMMPPITAIRPPAPIMPMPIFCGSVVRAWSAPATLRCTP